MFRRASELGDKLVVGVYKRRPADSNLLEDEERFEALHCISLIDEVMLIDDLGSVLRSLKPAIVLKGREHKNRTNVESEIISEWNGKLIFSSGESKSNSSQFLPNGHHKAEFRFPYSYQNFASRHNIKKEDIIPAVERIKKLKVAVIGDIILDEYVDCDAVGLSREDPTIVVTPTEKNLFIGGAAIVAQHARSFGADVDFFSVSGVDDSADWLETNLVAKGVNCHIIKDETRPTTIKRRYRSEGKTLLRVNDYRSHSLDQELSKQLLGQFEARIKHYDVVIFSDFSYGLLHSSMVDALQKVAKAHGVTMVADSQTSSQRGDLSKFLHTNLVTPTEMEARLAAEIMDNDVGLAVVIEQLANRIKAQNVAITLGAEGALFLNHQDSDNPRLDSLPALNKNPVDVSGAGDLLLISSTLLMQAGCNLWQACMMGMVASSIHISRIGNSPIDMDEFMHHVNAL